MTTIIPDAWHCFDPPSLEVGAQASGIWLAPPTPWERETGRRCVRAPVLLFRKEVWAPDAPPAHVRARRTAGAPHTIAFVSTIHPTHPYSPAAPADWLRAALTHNLAPAGTPRVSLSSTGVLRVLLEDVTPGVAPREAVRRWLEPGLAQVLAKLVKRRRTSFRGDFRVVAADDSTFFTRLRNAAHLLPLEAVPAWIELFDRLDARIRDLDRRHDIAADGFDHMAVLNELDAFFHAAQTPPLALALAVESAAASTGGTFVLDDCRHAELGAAIDAALAEADALPPGAPRTAVLIIPWGATHLLPIRDRVLLPRGFVPVAQSWYTAGWVDFAAVEQMRRVWANHAQPMGAPTFQEPPLDGVDFEEAPAAFAPLAPWFASTADEKGLPDERPVE